MTDQLFKRTMSISQLCWREAAAASSADSAMINNKHPDDDKDEDNNDDVNNENSRFRGEKRSLDSNDSDQSVEKKTGETDDEIELEPTTTAAFINNANGKKTRTSFLDDAIVASLFPADDQKGGDVGEDNYCSPRNLHLSSINQRRDSSSSSSGSSDDDDNDNNVFSTLSDDILSNIFKFVGCGHYIFVAGTCRRFNSVYRKVFGNTNKKKKTSKSCTSPNSICSNEENNDNNNFRYIYDFLLNFDADDKSITTSMKSVVESISRSKLFLNQKIVESNNRGYSNLQQWSDNEATVLQKLGNAAFLHKKYDVLQFVLEQPGAAIHILHPAVTKGKIP